MISKAQLCTWVIIVCLKITLSATATKYMERNLFSVRERLVDILEFTEQLKYISRFARSEHIHMLQTPFPSISFSFQVFGSLHGHLFPS